MINELITVVENKVENIEKTIEEMQKKVLKNRDYMYTHLISNSKLVRVFEDEGREKNKKLNIVIILLILAIIIEIIRTILIWTVNNKIK